MADLLARGRSTLAAAGVASPALDARVLLTAATGLDHAALVAVRRAPTVEERARYEHLIAQRAARVPAAYLTGEKEFFGRAFRVSPSVLIPRPETEHLVELALAHLSADRPAAILDLGTGSGAILVTLLAERPNATGIGVDLSLDAAQTARANAQRHGVAPRASFLIGDWCDALAGTFDLIVANPPYLTREELGAAQPELAKEPRLALDGGSDGLAAYKRIAPSLACLLKPGALALLEIGASQAEGVVELVMKAGLESVSVHADFSGKSRVISALFSSTRG